ncbi:MAG: hypothetical protein JO058_04765 [Alphaproteobacteria bacterium]|nr:hypothetical protein [Alphaproteobacteria bacterium]
MAKWASTIIGGITAVIMAAIIATIVGITATTDPFTAALPSAARRL